MQSRITGTTMPVLEFALEPNETIISEAGELSWMGSSIQMTTHTQFAGGGGIFGVLKRVAGGGSVLMRIFASLLMALSAAMCDRTPAGQHEHVSLPYSASDVNPPVTPRVSGLLAEQRSAGRPPRSVACRYSWFWHYRMGLRTELPLQLSCILPRKLKSSEIHPAFHYA